MSLEKTIKCLKELGLSNRDNYELPTSKKTFPDGAHFRTEELPDTVEKYEKMFSLCDKYDFVVNKITDVRGTMFDSDEVLLRKLELAIEYGTEVFMGPGAGEHSSDISHQAAMGVMVEGKIRGMDQIYNTIRELLRATNMGCRGFLMYDEGLLYIACKMRKEGILPPEMKFKISANVSVANASAIKFWFCLLEPQDSINPIRDLTLPMISAIREVTDNALDIHLLWGPNLRRHMDAPEIVRIGSPVYLKNSMRVSYEERFLQAVRYVELLEKVYPDAKQSKPGVESLAIPGKPGAKW